ncbi:hypothetical protein J2Y03_002315 [Neobacillus niacini]|nr:hypothetical protein [Neobacillus niacini]
MADRTPTFIIGIEMDVSPQLKCKNECIEF